MTDANNCSDIESFVIENEMIAIRIEDVVITNVDCPDDTNGSIALEVIGSAQPFTYEWSDGQETATAIGLGVGTYSVTVTDANGVEDTGTYTITATSDLSASLQNPNDISLMGQNDCDAEATVLPLGGQAPYSYFWSSSMETTSTAFELCAGIQTVVVTDALGCAITISFTVSDDAIPLQSAIQGTNVGCNGEASGSVIATPFGGTSPYTYMWNTGDTSASIGGLIAGTYFVTITDAVGTVVTEDQTVFEADQMELNFNVTPESGMLTGDGIAEVVVFGGTAPFTYQWNNSNPPGGCVTPICENLTADTYFVVVQDANECIAVDSVVVTSEFGGTCIETRNIITPDKDGKNDSFLIQCAPGSINSLEVFNRWGQLVFAMENYDNSWEGTNRKGQDLPAGGYFYVFVLEDSSTGQSVPFKGHITILRE